MAEPTPAEDDSADTVESASTDDATGQDGTEGTDAGDASDILAEAVQEAQEPAQGEGVTFGTTKAARPSRRRSKQEGSAAA